MLQEYSHRHIRKVVAVELMASNLLKKWHGKVTEFVL